MASCSAMIFVQGGSEESKLPEILQNQVMVDYFTNNGFSSAIGTTQHPAGEYYNGVTYSTYQGPLEDPYVAAYDHMSGKWLGPVKAGESIMGKTPGSKIDNHGKPAMIIDNEGYIHIIFGGHGGLPIHGKNPLGNIHNGQQTHIVSKRPQDISSWEVLDNIPPFGTYSQFVKMDNGDIYLFYRHGAHRSNWVYQLSTDNGRSFASPVSILKTKQTKGTKENPDIYDSWYAWFTKGHGKDIIATFNYHVCKEPNHDGERHNSYYMVMDTKDHSFYNVNGDRLTLPLAKEQADSMTLVVDTGELWTHLGTVSLDQTGKPHVSFYMGEHIGERHGGPKQVNHYRWTGQKWTGGICKNLPIQSEGDMLISSPDHVSLLLGGDSEVAWWHSTDGGKSFTKAEVLIKRENTTFAITSLIRNANPDAYVIAAGNDRTDKSLYRKLYLLGDQGPVRRLEGEADKLD